MIKRDRNIDIVKGIAIYCVLWGHCIQGMVNDVEFFKLGVVKFIYSFHMPLFALISGYLFFKTSQKKEMQIFKSRLMSLGIPFFIWNFLLYIRRCIFDILTVHSFQFDIMELLHLFVYGLWFLKSLFIITIIVMLLVKHSKKYKYLYSVVIWGGLIFFNNVFGDHTANLFPFFILGYCIAEHRNIMEKIYRCRYIVYLIFIILLMGMREEYFVYISGINPFISEYGVVQQIYFDFYRLIIGIMGSFSVILFVRKISQYCSEFINGFLEAMGRNTLQLYVLQSFFIEGVLSKFISYFPLRVEKMCLIEWIIAPLFAISYAVVLMIGIKFVGKIPYLSTVLFGVKKR